MVHVAVWILVAIILAIIEGVTVQLVTIWFVIGTVPAMVIAAIGGPIWLQLLMFFLTSIIVLLFGRPLVKERLTVKKQPTNSDRLIGQIGIVTEEINNIRATGRVDADGKMWTARTMDGSLTIPANEKVVVIKIEGVKLMVAPVMGTTPHGGV